MINQENLVFTPITPESVFTPQQVAVIADSIREKVRWQWLQDIAKGAFSLTEYFRMQNLMGQAHLQAFLDSIIGDIQLDLVFEDGLALTEEMIRHKIPHLKILIRREILRQKNPNQWLLPHSALTAPSSADKKFKLETAAADPAGKMAFEGVTADVSGLVLNYLDLRAQAAIDRVNHDYHEGMKTFRHQKICEKFKAGHVVYAIADWQVKVAMEERLFGAFVGPGPTTDISIPLEELIKVTKECLNGRNLLMFTSKEDACAYAYSMCKRPVAAFTYNCPIISMVNLGDQPLPLARLKLPNHSGEVECAFVKPQGYLALGVEIYGAPDGKPRASALLQTPFDVRKPKLDIPVDWDVKTTRFHRNEHHKIFMRKLKNKPLTVADLRCWLDVFYCDQYLRNQKNAQEKRNKISNCLYNIREAERSGLNVGTSLENFLALRVDGRESLKELICEQRKGSQNKFTWGWETIQNSFLAPTPVKITRRNRDEYHQNFMDSLEDGPTKENFIRWLREFYCPEYLCHQKGGAAKSQDILNCLGSLENGKQFSDLSLKEFLEAKPNKDTPSLGSMIQSCRAKEKHKISWGWEQVQNSFLNTDVRNEPRHH